MGSFSASLKTLGDRVGLPATVVLQDDRLSIAAGEEAIGEWQLDEIRLEPTPTGYRMAAEGEHLLIEMRDAEAFGTELSRSARPGIKITLPGKETLFKPVDITIEAAERRWGTLLPQWMFTRIMFGLCFGALTLFAVLPGIVSLFLLISGALLIMGGAITYADPMLSSRWLPGRMSPVHVLLFGVVILLLGVLLGVIAR